MTLIPTREQQELSPMIDELRNKLKYYQSLEKLYIVQCSAGSWDDYHWWIGGIFFDPLEAEKCAKDINDERKLELLQLKEFADKYLRKVSDDCYPLNEEWGEKLMNDIENFYNKNGKFHFIYKNVQRYNKLINQDEATVKEFDLNKRLEYNGGVL